MSTAAIIVEHNHLAEPGEHRSLLLVRYGTLTIEVKRFGAGFTVHALRSCPGRGEWTERAMDAASVDEAAAKARRLVKVLGP